MASMVEVFRDDLVAGLWDTDGVATVDAVVERVDGTFDVRLSLEDDTRVTLTTTITRKG